MEITTEAKPLTQAEKEAYSADFDELVAEEKTKLSEDRQFLLKREVTRAWEICLRAGVLEAQMRHLSDSLKSWDKNTERTFITLLVLSLLPNAYHWLTGDDFNRPYWSELLIGLFLVGYAGFLLRSFLPAKNELSVKDSEFNLLKNQFLGMGGGQATFYYFLEKNIVYEGLYDYRKLDVMTRIRRDIFESML